MVEEGLGAKAAADIGVVTKTFDLETGTLTKELLLTTTGEEGAVEAEVGLETLAAAEEGILVLLLLWLEDD